MPNPHANPCRKRRYRDKLAARLALAAAPARRKKDSGKDERRVYRCTKCAGWHITSKA